MTYCSKLSPTASAHPADVVAAKLIMRGLGHYEAPSWGISEYPDRDLFDAIKDFQAKQGLTVDGVINENGETVQALAQRLQAMGRNGDTILAHINPAEAELLDRVTDGGSVNPLTGLIEFSLMGGFGGVMDAIDSFNEAQDHGGRSSGNMNGPDDSGDDNGGESDNNNDAGVGQGDDQTSAENSTDNADDPEGQSDAGDRSAAQHAGALQQNEEDDDEKETLGDDPFDENDATSKPSQPDEPKEAFSLGRSLVEDLTSLVTGLTSTGEKRGSKSAYDTRAARGKARDLGYDPDSVEGRAIVDAYHRGGDFGPGSVHYNPSNLHDMALAEQARELSQNAGRSGSQGSSTSSNNSSGAHTRQRQAAALYLPQVSPVAPVGGFVGLDGKPAPVTGTGLNNNFSVLSYLDEIDPLAPIDVDLSAYGWLDEEELADGPLGEKQEVQSPDEELDITGPRMDEYGNWYDQYGNVIADPLQTHAMTLEVDYKVGKNAPKPSNDFEQMVYDYFPEVYDRVMNPDRNRMFAPEMTTIPEERRAELAANLLSAAIFNETGRMMDGFWNPSNMVNKGLRNGFTGLAHGYTEDVLDPTGKMKSNVFSFGGEKITERLANRNFSKGNKAKTTSPTARLTPPQQKTMNTTKRRQQRKDVITSGAQSIIDGFLANRPLTTEEWARRRAQMQEDDMKIK